LEDLRNRNKEIMSATVHWTDREGRVRQEC